MPAILSSSVQSRWKDCFAPSPRVRLTLRTNGEEEGQVITPQNAMVKAGFVAPTATPTVASGGAGNLTNNTFCGYRYVYASSAYPFVDNAVTGGGELWPRSSPSPASATFSITGGAKQLVVTVTKTTRSDVDWIWLYRTALKTTSAEASAASAAGEMFYVGRVANDGIAGTTTYTDSTLVDTSELLELDNYVAPTMQFCIFDGTQWFGIGNFSFDYEVTLNSTSTVTLTGWTAWFSGRDGQTATFDGLTTGGYDGRGSFYFKWVTATTATMYSDAALTTPILVLLTGTTKIHLKGQATTLYRSKPLNPFSWGQTDVTFNADGSTTSVASEYAIKFGAGSCSAMSLVGNDSYLILSFEEPTSMVRLALDQSDSDAFALTAKDIDTQSGFGSHFSQVLARNEGRSMLSGVDGSSFDLIATGGDSAQPISDAVFQTMRSLYPDATASRLFHSVYDSQTELTAFWLKTKALGTNLIDTCLLLHGPTGRWSLMPDQQVSASATIYDPVTRSNFTMLGLENGYLCTGFDIGTFTNILEGAEWALGLLTQSTNDLTIPNVLTTATSIAVVSGTTWLVTAVTGKARVGLGISLSFYDVSNVLQGVGTVTAIALVQALAGDYYTFTVTSAAVLTSAIKYSLHASNANGLWMYVVPVSQTAANRWVRLAAGASTATTHTWTPDYIYEEEDTSGYATLSAFGTSLTGATGYAGCIPCRHRRYFDLDEPTKTKALAEAWATMQNVGTHYCRVFEEFDTALVQGNRFQLGQKQKANGNVSLAWNAQTTVPSSLQVSFGFELLEMGYRQFKNYNYVLMFRPSP